MAKQPKRCTRLEDLLASEKTLAAKLIKTRRSIEREIASIRLRVTRTRLTKREQEILELIKKRLSNKEIGSRLNISTRTAKWHVSNVIRKMGVASRWEL